VFLYYVNVSVLVCECAHVHALIVDMASTITIFDVVYTCRLMCMSACLGVFFVFMFHAYVCTCTHMRFFGYENLAQPSKSVCMRQRLRICNYIHGKVYHVCILQTHEHVTMRTGTNIEMSYPMRTNASLIESFYILWKFITCVRRKWAYVVHENKVNKVHVNRNRFFIIYFLGLIQFFS
jgi:hypothetical protein